MSRAAMQMTSTFIRMKTQLMAAAVGSSKTTSREKLYYNGSADEYRALMGRNFDEKSEQMTLF